METKALNEKFTQTELGTLKNELVKMEHAAKIKDDRIRQLEDSMRLLQQNLDGVSKVLNLNPTVEDVESALQPFFLLQRAVIRFNGKAHRLRV